MLSTALPRRGRVHGKRVCPSILTRPRRTGHSSLFPARLFQHQRKILLFLATAGALAFRSSCSSTLGCGTCLDRSSRPRFLVVTQPPTQLLPVLLCISFFLCVMMIKALDELLLVVLFSTCQTDMTRHCEKFRPT